MVTARACAAPFIMCMRVRLGGVAIVCDYPHPAVSDNPLGHISETQSFSYQTEQNTKHLNIK